MAKYGYIVKFTEAKHSKNEFPCIIAVLKVSKVSKPTMAIKARYGYRICL